MWIFVVFFGYDQDPNKTLPKTKNILADPGIGRCEGRGLASTITCLNHAVAMTTRFCMNAGSGQGVVISDECTAGAPKAQFCASKLLKSPPPSWLNRYEL